MEITKNITKKQAEKLSTCDQCGKCCRYGSGILIKDDIKKIAAHLKIKEETLKKHLNKTTIFNKTLFKPKLKKKPFGECIFLKNNLCSIHKVKPLQCRTSTCKKDGQELNVWFMSNYILDKNDPESIRQYKHFIKKNPKIKGASLNEIVPEKEKLRKILNFEILK